MFARYEADTDLGLLFTDGEYIVVIFENIGRPAIETFERLRLGLDTGGNSAEIRNEPLTCGATEPELLDEGLPLLVVVRRDDGCRSPRCSAESRSINSSIRTSVAVRGGPSGTGAAARR